MIDVPLASEVLPGFDPMPSWTGIYGPANLPEAVRTSSELRRYTGAYDSVTPLRNGKIGMIDRFTVYVSNLVPRGAAGKTYMNPNTGTDATLASALKRHAVIAGHKSAITFASQIAKVESLNNPNDFGTLVRGLNVYGSQVIKPEGLALALVN